MILRFFQLATLMVLTSFLFAQDPVPFTFNDTRVINAHSVETLPKRKLDVRISHRFGDIAGENGGWATLYGLENASDILIGADYGITNNLMVGVYRSKGAGSLPDGTPGLRQNLNSLAKYRILTQEKGKSPLSLAVLGVATLSTSQKVDNPDVIQNFAKFSHRLAYAAQVIVATRVSDAFAFQVIPSYTYRNVVPFGDVNGIFSLGASSRIRLTKVFGLILDTTFPLTGGRTVENGYFPALGLGLEVDTGGHVFQINLTNATGVMETDYIPYTISDPALGEFRLGFTISRMFNL
jgi:hypothetical protein